MKNLNQFITEYIIKKKLDKPIDSEHNYDYYPKTKDELIENLNELISKDIYDFNCIDTSNITDMSHLFDMTLKKLIKHNLRFANFDISDWDVSKVENMNFMFYDCIKFNCDLSNWDVSKVKNMLCMFNRCDLFKGKGLENWNVSNVKDTSYMFLKCENLNCDLSSWNVSKVENMSSMFYGCKNFNCDLSKWDVSNVFDMTEMFTNCNKFNCDLSSWDISKVYRRVGIFHNCTSLKNKPIWYQE